ncbi:PREDICTED: TPR repeat-containing thioredoxin TTL1-like isoform X2 [Ipomoea nil]|uniref:TPR repeat-containing thioredoxin TTL1-like isoform X2 n=1 Tax=Ipomoea nil TaxID=35883 RepID=UPI0009018CAC|nr:PREDICTED: TPR repeat-containing thioredoxin TTL1-like isoform X2 [Ipomoea nil]
MSDSRRASVSDIGIDALSDRLRKSLRDNGPPEMNKPDFRELDLGSPVSPLRPAPATTSSSSSSSGSLSGRNGAPKSGELSGSVESSPTPTARRGFNPRSGGSCVNSPPPSNAFPTGNICPSGRILKTGMASKSSKTDVLGSGTGNYGHGSIIRGFGSSNKPTNLMAEETQKREMLSNDPEELKRIGNENYKKGHFAEALNLYDKAISISPGNAAYHCNRAAALIGLKRLVEAVRECEEAIRLDPRYVRAHQRLGSLFLSLGQVENARSHICLPGHQLDHLELRKLEAVEKHIEKCNDARGASDWRSVLREADAAIASGADASPQLFACRAEALAKLHQLDNADSSLSKLPKIESTASFSQSKFFGMLSEAYVFFVRAQIELAHGRFESAVAAIERAKQIDCQNVEVSVLLNNVRLVTQARTRGNDLFKSERFTEACAAYGEGLRFDPSNSVLYCNRAACWYKLGQWEKSVDDCSQTLRIQPNYTKALLRRAASNMKLERWAEAVRDYEALRSELPHDTKVAESLFHAQVALKKSKGEEVYSRKFGGGVEIVSGLEQFQFAISSGTSVVHFKVASNTQCTQISPFLDTLCTRYPSIIFLKVDVEDSPAIATAESITTVPTFKIYRNGSQLKELVCPSPEELETSVRHWAI